MPTRRTCGGPGESSASLGGAAACNSFTKFYLALLGQFPYANCPSVPPEMMLLPRWSYFNLYAMSSWTRTIVVPLSIFSAHKPVRTLPPERGIAELFLSRRTRRSGRIRRRGAGSPGPISFWPSIRRSSSYEELGPGAPAASRACGRASAGCATHFADSDGVGAIFPPMIYTVISLRCLGYADDSPEMI